MFQKKRGRALRSFGAMLVLFATSVICLSQAARESLKLVPSVSSTNLPAQSKSGTASTASPLPESYPRPARNLFEAQLALERQAISCGSIDGLIGAQTRSALRVFQQ